MKIRVPALAAAISTISIVSILTGCNGGGSSSNTTAYTPPVPTVTVSAPATAVAGFQFNVSWNAVNAADCLAAFSPSKAATATTPVVETEAGTKTYTVTCSSGGGSSSGSATVEVLAQPTAEGTWQGTDTIAGVDHTLSGVVTKEGDYWLAYTQAGNASIVGFFTGKSTFSANSETGGTAGSTNLREVNFTGGFSGGGNVAAGAIDSGVYTAKTSFSGDLNQVPAGAPTGAVFNASKITTVGNTEYIDDSNPNVPPVITTFTDEAGVNYIATTLNGSILTLKMSTTIVVSPSQQATVKTTEIINGNLNGSGVFTPSGSGQSTVDSCTGDPQICAATGTTPYYQVTGSVNLNTGGTLTTYRHIDQGITLTRIAAFTFPTPDSQILSSLPSITAGTFNLPTYDPIYETAPSLADLTGNYTGSAGVGVAMQTGATFNISSIGAITGSGGGCSYSGNAVVHPTGGNLYDVTLTFTGCSYSGNGTFKGTAVYDAQTNQVTIMAINTGSDTGFLFTGTKP